MALQWSECRLGGPSLDLTLTDAPVPADLAAAFGVLRRPQIAEEAAVVAQPPAVRELGLPARDLVRSSLRIVRRLADGTQLRIFVASEPRLQARPGICRTRERRELRRRIRTLPAQARRAALRQERRWAQIKRRLAALPPPGPAIYVTVVPQVGEAGGYLTVGASTLAHLRSFPPLVTTRRRGHTLIAGVAPDGVARVEVVLARGRSPFTRRFYRSTLRAAGAVVDNVYTISVDRPLLDTWIVRQTWRSADGGVVAEIETPL